MKKKITFTLLLFLVVSTVLTAHDFYISTTSIQHHPESQKLSIRIKIFVNDLERSIFQEQGVHLGLGTKTPLENAPLYLEQYLNARFFISINESPVSLKYISKKVEAAEAIDDYVILVQLEAYNISDIATIKIHNSILTEAFDNQTNIVNIRANDTRESILLDKQLPEDQISFR